MLKKIIPLLFIVILVVGVFLFMDKTKRESRPTTSTETILPIFLQNEKGLSGASWGAPTSITIDTPLGNLSGEQVTTNISSPNPSISHFENTTQLQLEGFTLDNNLAADGTGSSTWGYKKVDGTKTQVVLFSYNTTPSSSSPNQPLQFNCPCTVKVMMFVSDKFDSNQSSNSNSLANPASINCTKQGGTLAIETNGAGGQYGLCQFEDNMACEEWALYRGECPVGGLKTTGYDNIEEKYCAWLGGKTFAVPNAKCNLPNGHTCDNAALYNGTCN
jgi:putative hemolysin